MHQNGMIYGKHSRRSYMRSFVDDARHVPTPLSLTSRTDLINVIKSTHISLLQAAVMLNISESNDTNEIASLRRFALWLDEVARRPDIPTTEKDSIINLAANL